MFAALGVGMALPYVVLAWHPRWLRWLPKPGAWMVRFKQVLAVPLYATVLWLGWVLAIQTGVLPDAAAAMRAAAGSRTRTRASQRWRRKASRCSWTSPPPGA